MALNGPWNPETLLQQGRALHAAGQLPQAEALYRQVLGIDPNHVGALTMLGGLCLQVRNFSAAEQLTGRAVKLRPDIPEFHNNHGIALYELGRIDDGAVAFRKAIGMRGDYAEAHYNLGRTLQRSGTRDEALACYRKALKLRPRYPQAHYDLAVLLKDGGEWENAEHHFRRAIEAVPHFVEAHLTLGQLLAEQKRYEEAIACWKDALQVRPDYVEAINNLGLALSAIGQLEECVRLLMRSLDLKPAQLPVMLQVGFVQLARRRLEESQEMFEKAIATSPGSADAHRGLGRALTEAGRLEEAIAACEKAVALAPAEVKNVVALSLALTLAGREKDAIQVLRSGLEQLPDSAELAFELSALTCEGTVPRMPPEMVTRLFDEYAESFESHVTEKLNYSGPVHLREAVEAVTSARGLDVLDLGCGTGLCGVQIRPMARRLVGVDLSPSMVSRCKSRGVYDEVRMGDIRAVGNEVAAYDLILSGDVFIYVGDLEETFHACANALRPGGLLGFTAEKYDGEGYVLRRTRRFAHSLNYLRGIAQRHGMAEAYTVERPLRLEMGQPIAGWIVVLRKGNPAAR